jgi:hypothetical protein
MPRHTPTLDDDEYSVFVAGHRTSDGRFTGALKVVRKADKRLLFPFDGAPVIGPYRNADEARRAAVEVGKRVVTADRAAPEA